jgi:hypothetical protein
MGHIIFINRRMLSKNQVIIALILIIIASQTNESSQNIKMQESEESRAKSVAQAMVNVIREFYIRNGIDFDFIIYGQASPHINDVINAVYKDLSNETTVNIRHIRDINEWHHELKRSAIFLIKEVKDLWNLHLLSKAITKGYQLTNDQPMTLKFLTYTEKIENQSQLNFSMKGFMNFGTFQFVVMQHFEYFLYNDGDGVIVLSANVMFSDGSCDRFKMTNLNTFNTSSRKWNQKLESWSFFENFNGCLFSFLIPISNLVYSDLLKNNLHDDYTENNLRHELRSDSYKLQGLANELLVAMSKRANFTFHYVLHERNPITLYHRYFRYRNFMLNREKIIYLTVNDIAVNCMIFHCSKTIETLDYYYLVTPNDLYTNYEKLMMPFDQVTWILLMITFGFTFGIIFGVHRCPQWIKNLVFGAGE